MSRATQVLAATECPFRGEPVIVIGASVAPEDSVPVRIHEEVHAGQCRSLGPVRYRWRNLFASGKLALEAPAYCAAAAARLSAGLDSARVSARLRDDATEALSNVADSGVVLAALRLYCPEIVDRRGAIGVPRRGHPQPRLNEQPIDAAGSRDED